MHRKTVLSNGVKIVSEQLDHMRSVSLGIWVNTGSRDEIEEEFIRAALDLRDVILKGVENAKNRAARAGGAAPTAPTTDDIELIGYE